jgi:hypothetical protein
LKLIAETEIFASEEIDGNYRVSCLWYRKVYKRIGLLPSSFPMLLQFRASSFTHAVEPSINEESMLDLINEEAAGETANKKTRLRIKPQHSKRVIKAKQRYSPPDQSTPKPSKRRKKQNKDKTPVALHKKQSLQSIIMIQLEYQPDRGQNMDRYQDVSIVMRLFLTIDGM